MQNTISRGKRIYNTVDSKLNPKQPLKNADRPGKYYDVYHGQHRIKKSDNGVITEGWLLVAGLIGIAGFLFETMIMPRFRGTFLSILFWPIIPKPNLFSYIKYGIIGFVVGFGGTLAYVKFSGNTAPTKEKKSAEKMVDEDPDASVQSYIATPEEEVLSFDVVPDTKVHFPADVTAILSHIMIKDTKGIHGKDGRVRFDNQFGDALFDTAMLPQDQREFFDAGQLSYNPPSHHNRDKEDGATLQDMINNCWHVPDCEDPNSQDPAGAYVVSTYHEHTVLVAETRAGKGQHYIEEMGDIWSREDHKPNVVFTDLKMELLVKFLRTYTLRGYNVKALNLLRSEKTDAINFLGYAVNDAIRGNTTAMQSKVRSLANTYFPASGSDSPMWSQAAGALFTRTVLILIDYYYEEIQEIKDNPKYSIAQILQKSDEEWGHVTLFNAYRFIIEMCSKMYPRSVYQDIYPKDESGNTPDDSDPQADSKSGISVYADATKELPSNSIREKIAEQDGAIRTVAPSERTLASIYAVCLFGMIFFTDQKVISLTSARPSQNLDMIGFAFPRRIAIKFNYYYAKKRGYINTNNKQVMTKWECFHDPAMKDPYKGDDYIYEGTIDAHGWADFYIKGHLDTRMLKTLTVPNPRKRGAKMKVKRYVDATTYIKLTIYDPDGFYDDSTPNLVLDTYTFKFKKAYRKTGNGMNYANDLLTSKRIISGGTMSEYNYVPTGHHVRTIVSRSSRTTYNLDLRHDVAYAKTHPRKISYRVIEDYDIHYTDNPTALFLVAPPNEQQYNQLLLNLTDLLYNSQVGAILQTADQHPYVPTKYLFDEFGNMQYNGTGVPDLAGKLTAGAGQDQQFTMVLQSMSQLKAIYKPEIANTLQSNVGGFFFIKSKDASLINMLVQMNGKKIVVSQGSQSFDRPMGGYHLRDEFATKKDQPRPKRHVNLSYSKETRDALSPNAYLHLNDSVYDGNAIVSRGSSIIMSHGPTILPMSFQLYGKNHTGGFGHDIKPDNLPMLGNQSGDAANQIPDFEHMLAQRIEEAKMAPKVYKRFLEVSGLNEYEIKRKFDQDELAKDLMRGIHLNINQESEDHDDSVMDDVEKSFNDDTDDKLNDEYGAKTLATQSEMDDKSTKESIRYIDIVQKQPDAFAAHSKALYEKRNKNNVARKAKIRNAKPVSNPVSSTEALLKQSSTTNVDFQNAYGKRQEFVDRRKKKLYAGGTMSAEDLCDPAGRINASILPAVQKAIANDIGTSNMNDGALFHAKPNDVNGFDIYDPDGNLLVKDNADQGSNYSRIDILPAFGKYLSSLNDWNVFSKFDQAMKNEFEQYKQDREQRND